jgi:hypothetical protein
MSGPDHRIGGLLLPSVLLKAIEDGRWEPRTARRAYLSVFGEEPDDPRCYGLAEMARQNKRFQQWTQDDLVRYLYVGKLGLGIDPALAVIIGDLGTDSPVTLDYRLDRDNPRVLYLKDDGWYEVAADFATLERLLGIAAGEAEAPSPL